MGFSDLAKNALGKVRNTLGEEVTYTPNAGDPLLIKGVFSNQFVQVDQATGAVVSTVQPNLLISLADLDADPTQLDTVDIGGATYRVTDSQPDGEGGSLLMLNAT